MEITKEFLEEHYVKSRKSFQTIAKEIGVCKKQLSAAAKKFGIQVRKSGQQCADITGQTFNGIKVLSKSDTRKNTAHPLWRCLCKCGNIFLCSSSSLRKGQKGCAKCFSKTLGDAKRKGYQGITGEIWSRVLRSARVRGFDVTITIQDAWDLYEKQGRKCALTGISLIFAYGRKGRSAITASLDRIDSSKGYHIDNVQWVHKVINNIKMDLQQDEFIKWCGLVAAKFNTGHVAEKTLWEIQSLLQQRGFY